MDKPSTPAGGDGSKLPWDDDAGSGSGFGATGIFSAISLPDEPAAPPAWTPVSTPAAPQQPLTPPPAPQQAVAPRPGSPLLPWEMPPAVPQAPATASSPGTSLPSASGKPLAEPVVHKVVLGSATEETQLHERIRMVTAERSTAERPAYTPPKNQGNGGFTELLRTLGSETPVPNAAAKSGPAGQPVVNSGFTSLLQTLNAPTLPKATPPIAPAPAPVVPVQAAPSPSYAATAPIAMPVFQQPPPGVPAAPWTAVETAPPAAVPETPRAAAPIAAAPVAPSPAIPSPIAPAPGGFTELLRMSGPDGFATEPAPFPELGMAGSASSPAPPFAPTYAPAAGGPGSNGPSSNAPASSGPGEFTRLFGTFSADQASADQSTAPSFAPPPRAPEPYNGGSPNSFTSLFSLEQHSQPLEPAERAPAYREEAPPLPGTNYGLTPNPAQSAQTGASTGRDPMGGFGADPVRDAFWQEPQQAAPAPENTPSGSVGVTQLLRMLDAPAPQASAPYTPPPSPQPAAGGPGVFTQTFAALAGSAPPPSPAAPPSWQPQAPVTPPPAPPASAAGPSEFTRLIDASRAREVAMKGGAPAAPAAPAPSAFGSMPPPPMPGFAAPQMPQAPPMPGMAPPQPGGFAPPQMPQMPGGFAPPAMPAIPAAQAPAVKPPPAGKLQQMVPILLVVAIVLLLVVLVTVIFLLKK